MVLEYIKPNIVDATKRVAQRFKEQTRVRAMHTASVAVVKETGAIIDRGRIDLDEMSAKLQDAAGKIAAAAEAAKKLSVRTDSKSDSDSSIAAYDRGEAVHINLMKVCYKEIEEHLVHRVDLEEYKEMVETLDKLSSECTLR
eukprot:COSAG05_NODE_5524_length_1152_cov_18.889839_2_plen_142_part_00